MGTETQSYRTQTHTCLWLVSKKTLPFLHSVLWHFDQRSISARLLLPSAQTRPTCEEPPTFSFSSFAALIWNVDSLVRSYNDTVGGLTPSHRGLSVVLGSVIRWHFELLPSSPSGERGYRPDNQGWPTTYRVETQSMTAERVWTQFEAVDVDWNE